MADKHPDKFAWFERIEQEKLQVIRAKRERKGIKEDEHGRVNGRYQGTWKDETTYEKIRKHKMQSQMDFDDFSECDSGHCGL